MLIIVAQIILALSIIGILIIIFRKIPAILRYPRYSSKQISDNGNLKEQWDKIKQGTGISGFFHDVFFPGMEKFLRKLKIILLKFDNFLAKRVDNLRKRIKRRNNQE